jgi:hypothetical protein
MSADEKTADITQAEQRHFSVNDDTKVKQVQNVALADANSKQKPSPWTRRMFMVSP